MSETLSLYHTERPKEGNQIRKVKRTSTYCFSATDDLFRDYVEAASILKRTLGTPFSFQAACASLMLDRDRGNEKSKVDYYRIWGWSENQLRKRWGEIQETLEEWKTGFGRLVGGDGKGTERGRKGDGERCDSEPKTQPENGQGTERGRKGDGHTITSTSTSNNKSINTLAHSAEKIYALYPRKVKRKPALTAISNALKRGKSEAELIEATQAFATYWQHRKEVEPGSFQYCPYPASWYNAEGYDDDRSEWEVRKGTQQTNANGTRNGAYQKPTTSKRLQDQLTELQQRIDAKKNSTNNGSGNIPILPVHTSDP